MKQRLKYSILPLKDLAGKLEGEKRKKTKNPIVIKKHILELPVYFNFIYFNFNYFNLNYYFLLAKLLDL